ncbi:hypothetical protein Goari_020608 [Gossypium aridum]|uniref:DUF4283 domain-containing protein n=1 Tax=Gossypium aridum TaxID=34290 RepID=A0A7J8YV40_GOSAI|nr:hypothetical protein [Gossypium aridum]
MSMDKDDMDKDDPTLDFNDEKDFKNVLTKGPWVIFGQYLTVRPWLPNFLTAQDEVESQVVEVWLHGLSKGHYSTSILQAIRLAIGPMVKTDDNMENASRGWFNVLNENHRGDGMAKSVMEKERITEKDKGKENRGKTSSKNLASHRKKGVNLKGNGLEHEVNEFVVKVNDLIVVVSITDQAALGWAPIDFATFVPSPSTMLDKPSLEILYLY